MCKFAQLVGRESCEGAPLGDTNVGVFPVGVNGPGSEIKPCQDDWERVS